ncbi:MAG: hypothetical protein NC308_09005 [Clostridium sp.]|nr:hypothetical protein [Bacteroides sp.]MCM1199015.1 hypothetical protein [Clostridium sp.]
MTYLLAYLLSCLLTACSGNDSRLEKALLLAGDNMSAQEANWVSAGKVIASSDSILYKGIPKGTIYILDNLTRGNQIRVFSYDDGAQEWLRPLEK